MGGGGVLSQRTPRRSDTFEGQDHELLRFLPRGRNPNFRNIERAGVGRAVCPLIVSSMAGSGVVRMNTKGVAGGRSIRGYRRRNQGLFTSSTVRARGLNKGRPYSDGFSTCHRWGVRSRRGRHAVSPEQCGHEGKPQRDGLAGKGRPLAHRRPNPEVAIGSDGD